MGDFFVGRGFGLGDLFGDFNVGTIHIFRGEWRGFIGNHLFRIYLVKVCWDLGFNQWLSGLA
jgi:hypothetical protein